LLELLVSEHRDAGNVTIPIVKLDLLL